MSKRRSTDNIFPPSTSPTKRPRQRDGDGTSQSSASGESNPLRSRDVIDFICEDTQSSPAASRTTSPWRWTEYRTSRDAASSSPLMLGENSQSAGTTNVMDDVSIETVYKSDFMRRAYDPEDDSSASNENPPVSVPPSSAVAPTAEASPVPGTHISASSASALPATSLTSASSEVTTAKKRRMSFAGRIGELKMGESSRTLSSRPEEELSASGTSCGRTRGGTSAYRNQEYVFEIHDEEERDERRSSEHVQKESQRRVEDEAKQRSGYSDHEDAAEVDSKQNAETRKRRHSSGESEME